jgi:1-acyl-sn-glycerol-3-phosphate acyltransferase
LPFVVNRACEGGYKEEKSLKKFLHSYLLLILPEGNRKVKEFPALRPGTFGMGEEARSCFKMVGE